MTEKNIDEPYKKISRHFQDKTLKIVNSRTEKIPGYFQVSHDTWTPCTCRVWDSLFPNI